MKSQNYISLKILTLALLLIASCEVWAVNFGQSQITNLKLSETIEQPNPQINDIFFDAQFYNYFIYTESFSSYHVRTLVTKDYVLPSVSYGWFCNTSGFVFPSIVRTIFCTDPLTGTELIDTSWGYSRKCDIITSNGKGGGDWSFSGTWKGGRTPSYGDEVVIAEGDEIILDKDVYLKILHLKTKSSLKVDSKSRRLVIDKDLIVNDSARIDRSNVGYINCYIRAEFDGTAEIKIANSAIVNFESLKVLGKTYYTNGNINVSKFYTPSPSKFIVKDGVAISIAQKKYIGLRNFIRQVK